MDLDAYVAAHLPSWQRLEVLLSRSRLSGPEADEMITLYQRAATHLSVLRSGAPDPEAVAYLSALLTRARGRAARGAPGESVQVGRYLAETFPAVLYRTRRWWLATLVINVLAALAMGWWFTAHPEVIASLLTPGEIDQLVNHDFEHYYSEHAAGSFAFHVWTNNALVAAKCVAFGVLGLPVVMALWDNTLNLALNGALMISHGRGALFFGLILPHGLLELTSVFVAGGMGLRLFWSWIEPGPRSRAQAIGQEGRALLGACPGLAVVLLVCGLIEGFVTPSGLPTWARVGLGVLVEIGFFVYVFTVGRWAARRGETGDLEQDAAGYTDITAG